METSISNGSLIGNNCQEKMHKFSLSEKDMHIIFDNRIGEILNDKGGLAYYFISESLLGDFFKVVFTFYPNTTIVRVQTILRSSKDEFENYLKI